MFRIGLSSCGKPFTSELLSQYKKAGIDAIEISLSKEDADAFDFAYAERLSKEYGVEMWSFHLPFMPFDEIDISSPRLSRKTVPYLCEMIKKGAFYGIRKFVVHPSGEPIEDSEREKRLLTAMESLRLLSQTAAENGAVIAVENLPRSCIGRDSGDILRLLEADEALMVCFDSNHLLRESHKEFLEAVGDRIITTHISDYDFTNERHWLPGEGKM
ncbi:MAG: sugar phosphate isomerase/epimerase, partial [Oscillospiraceae bacterium]|nr:sugar phosphate isomerase/epimerase [Oscillospiraceae bacterium]